jgi:phosphoglycolate phosphatase-like HAD superfamily hydrolase
MISHVVWDWNGTLLDDLDIVIEALNVGISGFGVHPIDEHEYRNHFTRPIRSFYDSLLARTVSDMEWELLNKTFHEEYFSRVHRARLAGDAMVAIEHVEARGWGQSLLSMTTQDQLNEIVASFRVADRFLRIDGLRGETGGLKAGYLADHLKSLGVQPSRALVVGDTPDDAAAARHVGARVVLYDGGSHHPDELSSIGVPVVSTLVEALETIS